MSKCSRCQKDFSPLIKNNGLLYKTCDRCRYTDDKYRDKHKEQIKEYREAKKEHTKEYGIYYRELNKDMLKEKASPSAVSRYVKRLHDITRLRLAYPLRCRGY